MATMKNILDRDRTGVCDVGECKDLVKKSLLKHQKEIDAVHFETDKDLVFRGEKERQEMINKEELEEPESYPDATWTRSRNEAPGFFGGHC